VLGLLGLGAESEMGVIVERTRLELDDELSLSTSEKGNT
jgi:hypothetical protein